MNQEEAKLQAWKTFKDLQAKIDQEFDLACAPYEKIRDDDIDAAETYRDKEVNVAYDEYDKAIAPFEANRTNARDRAGRLYHEALAGIANIEVKKDI